MLKEYDISGENRSLEKKKDPRKSCHMHVTIAFAIKLYLQ